MQISIGERPNKKTKDIPERNEITVRIRNEIKEKEYSILEINEKAFDVLLEEYVDKAENYGDYDIDLENKILEFGINSDVFFNMKSKLQLLNPTLDTTELSPDFPTFINFPWKEWKEEMLKIYK